MSVMGNARQESAACPSEGGPAPGGVRGLAVSGRRCWLFGGVLVCSATVAFHLTGEPLTVCCAFSLTCDECNPILQTKQGVQVLVHLLI